MMRNELVRKYRTVAVGWMILAVAFSLVLTGYGDEFEMPEHLRELLARQEREEQAARKAAAEREARAVYLCKTNQSNAEAARSINFFGFYTGMPKADADALAAQYGVVPTNDTFMENSITHEVYGFNFSFDEVLRITKGPNSVEEEVLIVADQMQATSMRDYLSHNLKPKSFMFSTTKGIQLEMTENGCSIRDRLRAKKANEDYEMQFIREAEQEMKGIRENMGRELSKDDLQ